MALDVPDIGLIFTLEHDQTLAMLMHLKRT